MAKARGGLGKGLNALIPEKKMDLKKTKPSKGDIHKILINEKN